MLLRLVEFVRRVTICINDKKAHKCIKRLERTLNELLTKEAWQRWAQVSIQIGVPPGVGLVKGDLFALWDIWMSAAMKEEFDVTKVCALAGSFSL